MPNLNLVYINLEPADGYALQRGSVRVVWSRFPVEGCDLYAYNSAYSYFGERPGPQVLVHMEPVITQPRAFTTEVWTHFDYALTLIGGLDGVLPQMKAWPVPVYGRGPMPLPAPTYAELRERHPIDGRAHAICMINGAKTSRVPGELYTAREEIARWFGAHSEMPFDVYGQPAFMDLPGYVGSLTREEKPLTLAKYRYSLCFENCYDPFWSRGYITEKLPECIQSRTVPIYLGCWDIEEYFPDGCYIDYRRFDGCADLNDYLVNIPEDEYREYIANIDAWLRAGNLGTFTVSHLYDLLAGLYAEHTGQPLVELISGDESWTPCDVPPRLARVAGDPGGTVSISATDNIRQYWSWDYLADGDLDECARSLDVIRETQTLLASAPSRTSEKRRKTSREIRKVLYVGVKSTHGAHPPEREYNTANLFAAFAAWPGVTVSHVDPATQAIAWGVAGLSERLYQRVREEAFDWCSPCRSHRSMT